MPADDTHEVPTPPWLWAPLNADEGDKGYCDFEVTPPGRRELPRQCGHLGTHELCGHWFCGHHHRRIWDRHNEWVTAHIEAEREAFNDWDAFTPVSLDEQYHPDPQYELKGLLFDDYEDDLTDQDDLPEGIDLVRWWP